MITHVSLIGQADTIVAEMHDPPIGSPAGPVLVLSLGNTLALALDVDTAEQVAEAIIDAVTTRDDIVRAATGPVPYLPAWVCA